MNEPGWRGLIPNRDGSDSSSGSLPKGDGLSLGKIIGQSLISELVFLLVYLCSATIRKKVIHPNFGEDIFSGKTPTIVACWHGRMFYLPFLFRNLEKACLLVSPSEDGEILHRVARRFGYRTVRGSSYQRGTEAFRELVQMVRDGYSIGMIADGSRGPRQEAQMGSLRLAKLTGAPILPVALGLRWKKEFGSWDHFLLPLPFSRIVVSYGKPIRVSPEDDKETLEEKRNELQNELNRITQEADLLVA